jgi:hypothetical protein
VTIQSEALNKSFRHHDALRGISLAVPEGSIYALMGANLENWVRLRESGAAATSYRGRVPRLPAPVLFDLG